MDKSDFLYRPDTMDEFVIWENTRSKRYNPHFTSSDRWLDAGAHIGVFSVIASSQVNTIVACEPEKENFLYLVQNLAKHGVSNVFPLEVAVIAGHDKEVPFFRNIRKNTAGHSMHIKRGREEVIVQSVNILELISSFSLNKLKIDVEGEEVEILDLLLSSGTLSSIDEMIFEWHFKRIGEGSAKESFQRVIERLEKIYTVSYDTVHQKQWMLQVHCSK